MRIIVSKFISTEGSGWYQMSMLFISCFYFININFNNYINIEWSYILLEIVILIMVGMKL